MVHYSDMTPDIRKVVKIELLNRDINRKKLSELTGLSPEHISRLMNGSSGFVPEGWQKIFDAVGLELVVQAKKISAKD